MNSIRDMFIFVTADENEVEARREFYIPRDVNDVIDKIENAVNEIVGMFDVPGEKLDIPEIYKLIKELSYALY